MISEDDKREFCRIVGFCFHKGLRRRGGYPYNECWRRIQEMHEGEYEKLISDACKEGFEYLEKETKGKGD